MTTTEMVATLDAEIGRLRQVRELLAGAAHGPEQGKIRGLRAAGVTASPEAGSSGRKKRTLSPEARERIAAAQRARWAARGPAKGSTTEAAPKRGRGRPREVTANRSGSTKQDGAEGTA